MEQLSEFTAKSCFSAARKKRSNSCRRPHPDPKPITSCQNAFTVQNSPTYYGNDDIIPGMGPHSRSSLDSADHKVGSTDQLVEPGHAGNEKKPKKLKLKLGGVTRTIHTKSTTEITLGDGLNDASDGLKQQLQASPVDCDYKYNLVHKSKRVKKKRVSDEGFDEEDDEEIRYLKKLKASKVASGCGDRQEGTKRKTKVIAKLMSGKHSDVIDDGAPELGKDGRKKSRVYEDNDYEMEMRSDDELKSKSLAEDFPDFPTASGQEMTMTTRKRALECPESGGLVEFPNGLPDAPSKKQKLTEVEHQLRKTEAAQRRRLQAERLAKEAQAEAIRRILGQDSNRKKKEEKLKKQQEKQAQERTVKHKLLGPNTIRFTMGPNGTVVSFSEDLGLPKIFESLPLRYPPPREKCVGPNCMNEYKYRDSKSKLPLCSLHCYKAVQGNTGLLPAC